ncbi:hypothetical protein ACTXT7_009456 [Hymenolepis weldensis]
MRTARDLGQFYSILENRKYNGTMADTTDGTIEITDIEGGQYKFMCTNSGKNSEDTIILRKEFSEMTSDGGTIKATIIIEDCGS